MGLEKTIKQQLVSEGFEEELAQKVLNVALVLREKETGLGLKQILGELGGRINYFSTSLDITKKIDLQCDISDYLKVLEEHKYIKFNKGKYELTRKGHDSFSQ